LLRWTVRLAAILAASACNTSGSNSGEFSGNATGRVLAAPSDCIRASSNAGFSDFGYMCFLGSPGKPGDCVRVDFSNGGRTISGINRMPIFGSTSQPDDACSEAITSNFGFAAGLVVPSNLRCMRVALPFPGTKAGQLCGNISLGAPDGCVSVTYSISSVDSTPDVQSHSVLPSSACDGLSKAQ
jgi:hypothetical protein